MNGILARQIAKCKKEYDDYMKNPEKKLNKKLNKWTVVKPKQGYLSLVEGAIEKILSFKTTLFVHIKLRKCTKK